MKNNYECPICGNNFFRPFSYTGPTCGKVKCVERYLELQQKNRYGSFLYDKEGKANAEI